MKHIISKRKTDRILALSLTGLLCLSSSLPALAAENTSGEKSTPKEEVVYVNLEGDGSVKEINVVNIFDLSGDGQIIDYGKYESLRNMTTTDEINYSGDQVSIDAKKGKLYYEGKLESSDIPWKIGIRYYLDGKKYQADDLAGKSGALEIRMSVRQNKACDSSFFDGYALQASITLDTDLCSNISAQGAAIANVGSDKQLTYTILPGNETDITVKADVTDFEMQAVSINGVPLSLDVKVDDKELMDQITELADAIEKLDEGAGEINDGTADLENGVKNDLKSGVEQLNDGAQAISDGSSSLKDGGNVLQSGAKDLKKGADSLDNGVNQLNDGIQKMQKALNTLNQKSSDLTGGSGEMKSALKQLQKELDGVSFSADDLTRLTDASSQVQSGIDSIVSGLNTLQNNVSFQAYEAVMKEKGLDVDALKAGNSAAAENIAAMTASLQEKLDHLQKMGVDTGELQAQVDQLADMEKLLLANNANIDGMEAYLTALNENMKPLVQGAAELRSKYAEFDSALGNLVDTLGGLIYKVSALSSAIDQMVEKYTALDDGINSYSDGVAQIVSSYADIADGASALVSGSRELKNGTDTLYGGTSDMLSGILQFYEAAGSLKDGTGQLDEGVEKLLAGIVELYGGTSEMKDGTMELNEKTSGMDQEISNKIDELIESITGGAQETVSFVSDKNTDVKAVQFVIQTGKIEKPGKEEIQTEETQDMNFWQKLVNLFNK